MHCSTSPPLTDIEVLVSVLRVHMNSKQLLNDAVLTSLFKLIQAVRRYHLSLDDYDKKNPSYQRTLVELSNYICSHYFLVDGGLFYKCLTGTDSEFSFLLDKFNSYNYEK